MLNPFEQMWEDAPPETTTPQTSFTYPPSLPHDLACCISDEEVEALRIKFEYSPEQFDYLINRPDFRREFTDWRQRLISEGNSFKLKLRAMAEEYLPTLYQMMHSDLVTPSVKTDLFKYITRVAELEPAKTDSSNSNTGPKIVIEIANYTSPTATPTAIDITPISAPTPPGTKEEDYPE